MMAATGTISRCRLNGRLSKSETFSAADAAMNNSVLPSGGALITVWIEMLVRRRACFR